jgi:hypothetical protein
MTIPPNALAGVGIIFGAWLAAWTGRRAPVIIGFVVVAIIGTTPAAAILEFYPFLIPFRLRYPPCGQDKYVLFLTFWVM